MTVKTPFHTLVDMLTDAQNLYLVEVLGLNPAHFLSRESASPPVQDAKPATVVMTAELGAEEAALLKRILASVRLESYTQITAPAEVDAPHVLVFGGALAEGRHQLGHSVWWSLPALATMLGADHTVLERKKFTWNLLQQMVKEL